MLLLCLSAPFRTDRSRCFYRWAGRVALTAGLIGSAFSLTPLAAQAQSAPLQGGEAESSPGVPSATPDPESPTGENAPAAPATSPDAPSSAAEVSPATEVSSVLLASFQQLAAFPTRGNEFANSIDTATMTNDQTVSMNEMTLPSLWWNRDQLTPRLGSYRLIRSWTAYQIRDTPTRVVDVFVDSQRWGVLNYFEQYAVLMNFGASAQLFGYNTRLLRGSGYSTQVIGLYTCDFTATTATADDKQHNPLEFAYPAPLPCYASIDLNNLRGYRTEDAESGLQLPTPE